MKPIWKVPLVVLAILAILPLAVLASIGVFGAMAWGAAVRPITDAARYSEVRTYFGANPLIQHFPEVIPADATLVRFYFLPGFLQGGAVVQLRLQLPPEGIRDLRTRFGEMAIRRYMGGDRYSHSDSPGGMPTTRFYTSDSDNRAFPATYEILLLEAKPLGDPDFKWNHGYSYGVAIESSASEIVYWAEDW